MDIYYTYVSRPAGGDYTSTVLKLLGRYAPEKTLGTVARDSYQRPYIVNADFDFNYSHSRSALYLVAHHGGRCTIGIDIEPLSRASEIDAIAEVAFSTTERADKSLSNITRWTLKEAALKMHGIGFSIADPQEYTVVTDRERHFVVYRRNQQVCAGFYSTTEHNQHVVTVCSQKDIHSNTYVLV